MYSFDDCIRNNRAKNDCFSEEPIKSQYVTTFALLEYFCKEKRHDVSKYYGCISTYSNSPFVSLCQRNLKRRISSMSSEKSNDEKHIRAEFCSAFNEFTDCVHINFDRECGNSVAKLMKEGIKRSIRIILPECGSYRKSGSWRNL
uniref:DUF19 domain-containing protein n=1 Tax=Romanomermis culicivorax TaxID=13658 RepID=A0A915JZ48_ROMCU